MKVYIAAPFFNPKQLARVESIKEILTIMGIDYFSPKDESMFKQGDNPKDVLNLNCDAIKSCDAIIVVTDEKDVGTIWEAGYAYALKKPILYVWTTAEKGQKFNLMLAASGDVVYDYVSIKSQLRFFQQTGMFLPLNQKGLLIE